MNNLSIPTNADLLLVSDVHLKSPDDERGRLLLQLISEAIHKHPKHFILLGDIFDFCLGSTRYFRRKFAPIGEELTKLANLGTTVTFFEGNHEFELPALGWAGVEFVGEGTKDFILLPGHRIRAAHGDLVHATKGYRLFRAFLKSQFIRFLCTHLVPSRLLDSYALSHAKVSRASDHYRRLNHRALHTDVSTWLEGADIGLIGHFHTPYYEMLNRQQTLISVRDWSEPNFLLIKDALVMRGTYRDGHWHIAPAEKTKFNSEN